MKLYDSLSEKKINISNKKITIYNCGPTVYNYVHIGNIRPLITFDILINFLKYKKNDVFYVHNITDIDDKIINAAKKENISEKQLTTKYTNAYLKIMKKLNVTTPDVMPKVTKNINGIIGYIKKIISKKSGYIGTNGDVYFSIDTVKKHYCEISKQNINELITNSRKEIDAENKKNPLDFVLWKKTEIGENWKTPWNNHGRPGWHTECAYFIDKYIGKQVTIHGGGIDLKFPHHENENAQNWAVNNVGLAKIWMHCGHINMNNEKMSKSLGNIVYANDLVEKYSSNTIRWFFLQTKYTNPINYSSEVLENAQNELEKIFNALNNSFLQLKLNNKSIILKKNKNINVNFSKNLEDDLNFPNCVTIIQEQIKTLTNFIKQKDYKNLYNELNLIINELNIFGIKYIFKININNFNNWKKYLNKKDYANADKYRNKLFNNLFINFF